MYWFPHLPRDIQTLWSTLSYYRGFKRYKDEWQVPLGKRKQSMLNSISQTWYDSLENAKAQDRLCRHITCNSKGTARLDKEDSSSSTCLSVSCLTKLKNNPIISHHYPLYLLGPPRPSETDWWGDTPFCLALINSTNLCGSHPLSFHQYQSFKFCNIPNSFTGIRIFHSISFLSTWLSINAYEKANTMFTPIPLLYSIWHIENI